MRTLKVMPLTLTSQKSRAMQIRGVKGDAAGVYCKPLATNKMRRVFIKKQDVLLLNSSA